MKIESNSAVSFSMQNHVQEPKTAAAVPRKDELSFSTAYQQYRATPSTASPASQARIEMLADRLRQDTSFMQNKRRDFADYPAGQELAKEMILADEGLQDQVAKKMWESLSHLADDSYLPPSWRDIDVKAMLLSADPLDQKSVFSHYEVVLLEKSPFGLTDTEKLLSARLEEASFSATATFDQRMDRLFDKVRAEFEAKGMTFDESKSYSFSLDTSVYKFSVSGGTEEENALIAQVLNKNDYTGENLLYTLNSLYHHRQEDGAYLPWQADNKQRVPEAVLSYGVVSVSKEYAKQMSQLYTAWNRCRMDEGLKEEYGFGVDDLAYWGGKIVGKTPRAKEVIASDEGEFMKKSGYAYINLVKKYTGTPEFTEPLFVYENGKFQTTYKIYDEPSEEATNSAAIMANVQRWGAEREAFFENGRNGVVAGHSSDLKIIQKNNLFQQLVQDKSFVIGNSRHFWEHPAGRELAKGLILSNDDLLSQVAEMMWNRFIGASDKEDEPFLLMNHRGFDVKAILSGSDEAAIDRVLMNYELVLCQKARTTGLSKMERYLWREPH